jgi:hypothetical protein
MRIDDNRMRTRKKGMRIDEDRIRRNYNASIVPDTGHVISHNRVVISHTAIRK